jgi:dTDP-4-dehydrorhamnose reductase
VDGCETNKELAFSVNAYGAKNLAEACENIGSKIVHISTDYVFNGEGTIPFKESDEYSPQSIYGVSKAMGDNFVKEHSSKYFIIRPSWVYGYNGKNFVYTILKTAKEKGNIKVVNDQKGTPTSTVDLARVIINLVDNKNYGIFHCTCKGECTWYDFAKEIFRLKGIDIEVEPCTTEEFPRPAKRPAYSVLRNYMLELTTGDITRPWPEALEEYLKTL